MEEICVKATIFPSPLKVSIRIYVPLLVLPLPVKSTLSPSLKPAAAKSTLVVI